MTGKAHLILGTAVGCTIGYYTYGTSIEGFMLCCGTSIGSIFPDFDSKFSIISCKFPFVSFLTRVSFGHRNIIHTPFFLIIMTLFFLIVFSLINISSILIVGFFLGYSIHLFQDSLTVRGIKWLYPFSNRTFHIGNLTSGKHKLIEYIISFFIYCVFYVIFINIVT